MAIAFCAVALICSALVTSNGNKVMLLIAFNSFSFSGLRIVAITFQPFDANNFAVAFPKPVEAPVIKIVFILFNFCKTKFNQQFCQQVAKLNLVVAKMEINE